MKLSAPSCSLLSLALVSCLGLTSCSTTTTNYAAVNVVHASSTAPNVDVLVGTDYPASNLAFGSESAYIADPVGSGLPVNIYAAGQDKTAVLSANTSLTANSVVTVFALGQLANLKPVIYTESATDSAAPTGTNAKVRVVHGSYLAGPVDVYVTAPGTTLSKSVTPTLSNFTFGTITPYLTVPAGAYEVQITATGTLTPVLITVPSVTLTAGQLYSAIAVDPTSAPGSVPSVVLINDPAFPTLPVHP